MRNALTAVAVLLIASSTACGHADTSAKTPSSTVPTLATTTSSSLSPGAEAAIKWYDQASPFLKPVDNDALAVLSAIQNRLAATLPNQTAPDNSQVVSACAQLVKDRTSPSHVVAPPNATLQTDLAALINAVTTGATSSCSTADFETAFNLMSAIHTRANDVQNEVNREAYGI